MKLTHHSKLRMFERANIDKRNQKQFFINALRKGKSWEHLKDSKLKEYMKNKENYKCKVKVYLGYLFFYSRNNKTLYTIYKIPDELLKKEEPMRINSTAKTVYMYDLDNNLLKEFKTTMECAEYFNKLPEYINYNLKKYDKIRKDGKWYRIRRLKIK